MTATAATTATTLSMKLLADTKARRVLFAEASKEVVDFLLSLLALPIGTAVKLLGEGCMVGGAGNLYASGLEILRASLQSKTVNVVNLQGLEILRASLQSKTVLTDVVLGKKSPIHA